MTSATDRPARAHEVASDDAVAERRSMTARQWLALVGTWLGIALFLILRLATHRAKWLTRQGALTGLFLVCYAIFRISLENVRQPDANMPIFPLGLTMGMILSIPMILIGAWLIWRALKRPEAGAQSEPSQAAHES